MAEVTLKEYVERQLAERALRDPKFLAQAMRDPDSVVKPLIAEALGDDGSVDLGDVSTSVHVETADRLHFVLTLTGSDAGDAEVAGFADVFDLAGTLRGGTISIGDLGGGPLAAKTSTGRRCCTVSDPCHTDECTSSISCSL